MRLRVTGVVLFGSFVLATGIACGGRTAALLGDPFDQADDGGGVGSSGVGSSGSSSSGSSGVGSSSSGVGMPPPGGSSSGDDLDAPSTDDTGPACGPGIQSLGASSTIAACWACVSKGCGMQLYGCSQDCACNAAVGNALECVDQNGASSATQCFTSAFGGGDSLTTAFIDCLAMTANECGCGTTETPDTGTSCVMGGSSSGGNAECTSEIDETCGSNFYQVVCSCPANECVCFGDSTKIIPIDSCPLCPGLSATTPSVSNLLALCGFPN